MKKVIILFTLITLLSCSSKNSSYENEINEWHKERILKLKEPFGWLSLIGLHWVPNDVSSFGSAETNDIIINSENAPHKIGSIFNYGTTKGVNLLTSSNVLVNGIKQKQVSIKTDSDINPTIFTHGSLRFYFIERDGKLALRVKDSLSQTRTNFTTIDRFQIDPSYKVDATFIPYEKIKTIKINTSVDLLEEVSIPGEIKFSFNDQEYSLLPIEEKDSDEWFIVFTDLTAGKDTYDACRFLYVAKADDNGNLTIDFNKAYNPPCVFTDYATCPLPPKENVLNFEIKAGEKNWK